MAGQIIKRGDRTWLVRVFLGRDPLTGKRCYYNRTVRGNKKDAELIRVDLLKEQSAGTLTATMHSLLIGDLLEDVVRDYRVNNQSVEFAEDVVANLKPTFGKMPCSAIRPKHIDLYIDKRIADGRANATINRELSILRRAFNLAQESGILSNTPLRIRKLAEDNVRKGFFEHAEYTALRATLPREVTPVLTFAYYTGCRKSEILNLRWPQVDLIARMIRLEPGETKNAQARVLPLRVDELYETLVMLRDERDRDFPECPWVFTRRGVPIRRFSRSWEVACKAAGLWDAAHGKPTRIFHDLRRSGVRNLVRAGVPEKVAMLISGHKTRAVFERYNIVDERDIIAAMGQLNAYTKDRAIAEQHAKDNLQLRNPHTIGTQDQKRAH